MGLTLLDLREAKAAVQPQPAAKPAQVKEYLSPTLFGLVSGDGEDARYRRITAPATLRDLNPLMHMRMQQVCFFLKATTPFGKRIVELIVSYVVGEGFKVVAQDAAVQEVIDKFWTDNNLDEALASWCDETITLGELCLPVSVNDVDGSVRLGYVDPLNVESIEYGTLTTVEGTQTIASPTAVRLKLMLGQQSQERLTIVRRDDDPNSPTWGRLNGQCFFFAINKAKSATRGISELFTLADWIDVFDQAIFDFADRVRYLNAFVWHYILNGADNKAVEAFKKEVTKNPPRQGGVMVTNEQVKIEAQTPQFHGSDMADAMTLIKKYGLGGAGFSPMFFGDPVDSNRTTANEMEGPTGKKLTLRQNELRRFLKTVIDFVIDQAVVHGVIPEGANTSYSIQVPDLLIKDIQKAATTLQGLTASMAVAEDRGWVQGETAARAIHVVLSQLGVDVDSKEEYQLAQEESANKKAQAINDMADQGQLADALDQAKKLNKNQPRTPEANAAATGSEGEPGLRVN